MTDDIQARLDSLAPLIVQGSPHAAALGFELISITPGAASMRAPYREDLIGDPETRVLHGGVVTALLDHACGMAAFAGMGGEEPTATLDLRLDYMRPAQPGQDVIAEATAIKTSRVFAFVSAIAHDGDPDDPVATAHAAFMVTKTGQEAAERARKSMKDGVTPISRTPS
ncbi:thioesterase [Marinicauda salina]|uniref:Thioesterase n=1 Tax=Marinicauda salina TaxID=2135793 RepID=A0A2U2BXY2_9PROT|nr:PaaI family thioesterase [Marinicauda salina]PWE18871.1 thioesterase [Marinicauda salina]